MRVVNPQDVKGFQGAEVPNVYLGRSVSFRAGDDEGRLMDCKAFDLLGVPRVNALRLAAGAVNDDFSADGVQNASVS